MAQESVRVPQESVLVPQESIPVPQEPILVAQESILVANQSIIVAQTISWVFFQCFGPPQPLAQRRHGASTAPAQRGHSAGTAAGKARWTPQWRIQESFFPLEEPYSETLL